MSDEQAETTIYVLPTVPGAAPRAVIGQEFMGGISGPVVTWSVDMGMWIFPDGMPVPTELGDVITEHAKWLGMKW